MIERDGDKRLRVLVVDDEQPILEELRMFRWQDQDAELVGAFTNGAEALEFCMDNEVDLIISDVVMPVMDGLELLNRMKRVSPGTQFILLTCHESFRYAQEALRSGALDYIVKISMSDEDLAAALNKARTVIETASHARSGMEGQRTRDITRMFRRLIGPDPDYDAFREASQALLPLRFPLRLPLFYIRFNSESVPITQQEVLAALRESRLPEQHDCTLLPLSGKQLLGISDQWMQDRIEACTVEIRQALVRAMPYLEDEIHVHAAMGPPLSDVPQMRAYLRASQDWAELAFFSQKQILFEVTGVPPPAWPQEEQQMILEECRGRLGDTTALFARLQELVSERVQTSFLTPVVVKRFLLWWFASLLERKITMDRMAEIGERVNGAHSLDEAVDSLRYFWLQYTGERATQHPEIRRALELIDKYLDRPITLQSIADEVALSPHYLSRLFHAEIGRPFNQYVVEAKMQRAAKLLRQTQMKVYEVSDRIGISNYRYFAMLFKKHWGMTPLEYRRKEGTT